MVPSLCVELAAMPVTASGKVDRRALPAPAEIPVERASYVAPRNAAEETLAAIWAQVLRVDRVGVHDNFFELGGDSILAIQVIARANEAGVRLTPKQLFQHQTIAQLAHVAGTAKAIEAEQGVVTGDLPLTPVQHWFFERELENPQHWNQAFVLELRRPVDPAALEAAARALLAQHDALRLRFEQAGSDWTQRNAGVDDSFALDVVDIASIDDDAVAETISRIGGELQAGMRFADGPMFRMALFDGAGARPSRLLLAAHHLVVDTVSWRVIFEDLQRVYEQLARGEEVALPPKTTSYRAWAQKLAA